MKIKRQNYRGSILAYALVILTMSMIMMVSIMGYVSGQLKFSLNRVEKQKSLEVAEAGIFYYRWYLAHQTSGKTAAQMKAFLGNGGPLGFAFQSDYEGIGKYSIVVTPPDPSSTIIIVKSTGWSYKESDLKRTVQVRFRRPSWSEYAMLANDFMRFGEGTEVYGKIHSNEGIRFDGLAHNVVSSLVPTVDDPDHTGGSEFGVHTHKNLPPSTTINDTFRSQEAPPTSPVPTRTDVFQAGRQFPVSEVSFSGVLSDLSYMKGIACVYNTNPTPSCTVTNACNSAGTGCYFDASSVGRQIILKANGTYDIYTVSSYDTGTNAITGYVGIKSNNKACVVTATNGTPVKCVSVSGCTCVYTNYKIPDNGVIFVENNVWLDANPSGSNYEKLDKSYKGSTLMSTEAKVSVVAGGSSSTMFIGGSKLEYARSNGSNILGIIGAQDVEVINNSLDTLVISGAIIAQSGRVGRDDYGDYKSSLTVNGSIGTNQRYGFAWTDGTGYTTRILNFDNNLLYYPPPYFPTGTEYAIDLWAEL